MDCPRCGSDSSFVVDTRRQKAHVRRRRQCGDCGARFSTREVVYGRWKGTGLPRAVAAGIVRALDALGTPERGREA